MEMIKILGIELVVKILSLDHFVIKRIIRREFSSYLRPEAQKRILDLGCGTGRLTSLFSAKGYTGIDISQTVITLARRHKTYHFATMNAAKLDFADNTFDAILVGGVLHHIAPKEFQKTTREMARVLKPEGVALVIEAIHPIWSWNVVSAVARALDRGLYIRSPQAYRRVLTQHLFELHSYTKLGGFLDYAVFLLRKKTSTKR